MTKWYFAEIIWHQVKEYDILDFSGYIKKEMYAVDLFLMQLNTKWFTNVLISNIIISADHLLFLSVD